MYDLEQLRQTEFPLSNDYIYFNHASIAPIPARARDKMRWSAERLAEQPTLHFQQDGLPLMEDFHNVIRRYINAASPQEVVPITATNVGLNMVAQALPWQAGDNVIFCDHEFPSNAYPWMSLERDGVEVRQAPAVGGGLTLAALEPLVDDQTRVVAASAVQFFSGHRTDLATIGAFCRDRDIIFVVDAIQAAGHMLIDVQAMGIDVLAAGGQKSLMAPPGIGFLYVREALAERLQPRFIAPNATRDWLFWLDYDLEPLPGAERFMSGTPNVVGLFGLMQSISLLSELGLEHIDQHTTLLAAEAIERLARLGYEPITPREEHGPIATFKTGLDAEQSDALVAHLAEQGASVVKHLSPSGEPHLRLSFHCYNNGEELDQFEALMKDYRP
ncbi:MAG: aminotransferase class V-fold PLP-dependent enzyme [Anaerolineales bacterium]